MTLSSDVDKKRTLVNNIGRSIIKRLSVKFEGNDIMTIDDYDIYSCYKDMWFTKQQKANSVRQGIISSNGMTDNCLKLRIDTSEKSTSNATDNAIFNTYKNKFIIPLDFEILSTSLPFYQRVLGNKLCYERTFNNYSKVIKSSPEKKSGQDQLPDASYTISNISLEYDIVNNPTLAKEVRMEYLNLAVLFNRILRHRQIRFDKQHSVWNFSFNSPAKSLIGILMLFEEETAYKRDTNKFYNPNIQEVSITIEGKPNQLFSNGMRPFQRFNEIVKFFGEQDLKDNDANEMQKQLELYDVNVGEYLTDKHGLFIDFRTIDQNKLHGSGRRLENISEGISLQIEKAKHSSSEMDNCYIYLIQDAQLNIQNGQFVSVFKY